MNDELDFYLDGRELEGEELEGLKQAILDPDVSHECCECGKAGFKTDWGILCTPCGRRAAAEDAY